MKHSRAGRRLGLPAAAVAAALTVFSGGCEQKSVPGDAGARTGPEAAPAVKQGGAADRIESGSSSPPTVGNANTHLAARVSEALVREPTLKDLTIDVSASDGAVELFGTVDDAESRAKAAQVATRVPGVKKVTNHLVIVKGS